MSSLNIWTGNSWEEGGGGGCCGKGDSLTQRTKRKIERKQWDTVVQQFVYRRCTYRCDVANSSASGMVWLCCSAVGPFHYEYIQSPHVLIEGIKTYSLRLCFLLQLLFLTTSTSLLLLFPPWCHLLFLLTDCSGCVGGGRREGWRGGGGRKIRHLARLTFEDRWFKRWESIVPGFPFLLF
jgi:hypothetical protein